jgi:hypothetical protein
LEGSATRGGVGSHDSTSDTTRATVMGEKLTGVLVIKLGLPCFSLGVQEYGADAETHENDKLDPDSTGLRQYDESDSIILCSVAISYIWKEKSARRGNVPRPFPLRDLLVNLQLERLRR